MTRVMLIAVEVGDSLELEEIVNLREVNSAHVLVDEEGTLLDYTHPIEGEVGAHLSRWAVRLEEAAEQAWLEKVRAEAEIRERASR